MQPERDLVVTNADVSPFTAVAAARELWFRADFDACHAQLDTIEVLEGPARSEANLLRARAYYRQRCFIEVVKFLEPILATFTHVDEACTARMLHAAALARSGDVEHGLALLESVAASAKGLHAHKAIRAEITHARALVHWIMREPSKAQRLALEAESARADVISVRATELRGFVALTRQRYTEALSIFRQTLHDYRFCRERDTDLAENAVYQIANLEQMLRSDRIRGTHDVPWGRSFQSADEPVPSHKSVALMQTSAFDAWLYAHDGDRPNAFRKMRLAEQLAPNEFWRVWSLAGRAALSYGFGSVDDGREHAAEAEDAAGVLDWDSTHGEERVALLLLAEVLAKNDDSTSDGGLASIEVLARYDMLRSPISSNEVLSDDPRRLALESHVHGLVSRAQGHDSEARKQFETAYRLFRNSGSLWRSVIALLELDATPVASTPGQDFYLETAAVLIKKNFPRSFLARRLGRWINAYDDPIVAKLTRAREILRYLLDGWVPKDIAAMKGLAEGTIRNHIADLEAAFGLHSIQELIVACYQRGLGSASWSDDFDPAASSRRVIMPRDRSTKLRR